MCTLMWHLRDSYCYLLWFLSFLEPSHPYHRSWCSGYRASTIYPNIWRPPCSKPKDSPGMPPKWVSNRLHQQDPPPQESIILPPPNQPPTHILSAIAEGAEYPEFEGVPEMCLHQPINTSTEAEPSHSIATSNQATKRDLRRTPLWLPTLK
jgi:hypothetical protein